MGQHESAVNYQNLIRDLADMYPSEVSEVIIVELVANALDARATLISVDYDPSNKSLVIEDNGSGMGESQFEQYHDFAAGLKTRGQGIGFAGVGAKVSFNIATQVITETRSRSFAGGSDWHFQSEKKLVWEDLDVVHLKELGTRIEVRFQHDAPVSYDDLEGVLRRNYLPLFDKKFLDLESRFGFYSEDTRFVVNGKRIEPGSVVNDYELSNVREFYPMRAGKNFGYGLLGLASSDYPFGPEKCGVFLCTRGKVIKADFFNQFPGEFGPRVFGMIEIPGLIDFLTTSKTDFLKRSKRREFEQLYDPVRREFKTWLTELGVRNAETIDSDEGPKLERVLRQLVDEIPELGDFLGMRERKQVLAPLDTGSLQASIHEGAEITYPTEDGDGLRTPGPLDVGNEEGEALQEDESGSERARPISRQAQRGPRISFAERPEQPEMAWVDGNTIVINAGHPTYLKTHSNSSLRTLHNLYAIGTAVQRFINEGSEEQDALFIDRMMAAWAKK